MMANRLKSSSKSTLSNLKGDYTNIAFLLLLYVLQGIPIGLSSAIPLLLTNRKVSYSEQALFSFVTWPFSLKLLWAPIVDSFYSKRIGRRKSWLIPTQLAIGLFMLLLSRSIKSMIVDEPVAGPDASAGNSNILLLTSSFLFLNFLAATQDIAVDGWALTMLSRRNVGYASTCNTAGQTAGFFIGNLIFLALESKDFCNKYIRSADNKQPFGIVTIDEFLHIFGIVFIVITLLVAIIKKEKPPMSTHLSEEELTQSIRLTKRKTSEPEVEERELNVRETYSILYTIMNLSNFKLFAVILLTCKIGFSAPDAISGLKLIEAGVHKENLAMLAVPMVPLQIVLPWVISRMTCGPRPLDLFILAFPLRLIFGLIFPLIVYWTPSVKLADGTFPIYFYATLILIYSLHQVTVYSMFVSSMAFNAAISDPAIGGTYMTLLNTVANLGANWPSTLSLWLVDKLSITNCKEVCSNIAANATNQLNSTLSDVNYQNDTLPKTKVCDIKCETTLDGYYIECVACVIFGLIWLSWGASKLKKLQSYSVISWSVGFDKVK